MLRGIRTASANWLGKLVMGAVVTVLALSFAIWGIGDIFRGFGRSAVASVGSTEISIEQFRQVYNERIQQIAQQLGRPIGPDQARALGLDRQILGQMIAEVALDEWARRMGLGITDEEVAKLIRTIPAFHDENGQFDQQLFLQRLRGAGYTEPRFVSEQRRAMIRQHLTDSIGGLNAAPKTYIDALNSYQNEHRAIEYFILGPEQAGEIPAPTQEQLTAYFEANKARFRAPEYRSLTVLRLAPDDVSKWIQVSDEDVRKYYEARRSRYVTPGRRHIQQIIFPDADEARAAKQKIDNGASFLDIAKERGLSEQDIDLGFVTRAAFTLAPAVGEAAFSLPEGSVSEPLQSRLGSALIRVLKIEPDTAKPLEDVAAEIREDLKRDRARNELTQKLNQIEDERAAGATLAEAAQKAGLTPVLIDAVDRSGLDPTGANVTGLPPGVDVLGPAFSTGVNAEAEALRVADGSYVWFEVTKITPSRERNFDEVKDRVEARWREDQVAERLKTKVAAILDKLKAGTAIAEVAAADKAEVKTASELKRNSRDEALPPAAIAAVFRTAKGTAGASAGKTPTEQIVFKVTEVTVPPVDLASAEGRRLEQTLRSALSQDLLNQYIVDIEARLGTSIHEDALRRVVGGES